MRRFATVLAALLLAGCSNDIPATATPGAATPQATSDSVAAEPAEILALGEARLFESDKPGEAVEIAADGSVSFGGELFATLSTDGKMTLPDGSVMMEVQPDGSVFARGEATGLTLNDNGGFLTVGADTITIVFNVGGLVTVDPAPGPESPGMGHEGCGGAMAKACALVMFGMVATTSEGPESVDLPEPTDPSDPSDPSEPSEPSEAATPPVPLN